MRFSNSRPARRGAGGYTLAEVVVSLTVFIAILLGVLFIFNLNYRLARDRSDAAQGQEALRGAQHDLVRQVGVAGRGGLPRALAIGVENNVAPGRRIGGPGSPRVLAGTDILTVRGVLSAPLYRVGSAGASLRLASGGTATAGVIEIRDPSPQTGVAQDLGELAAAVTAQGSGADALLLTSQIDESVFAVVLSELGEAAIAHDGDRVAAVTLAFDAGGTPAALAGEGAAAALRGAALVGILEEYRFYVREAYSAPGDERSRPRPQLSMARFLAGTDEPWGGVEANLAIDLADNVVDLQVALGFDTDGDGSVADDPAAPSADEWLYDDVGDDAGEPRWAAPLTTLALVRITTVAISNRPRPGGPPADARLEDHPPGHTSPGGDPAPPNGIAASRWRLESIVDLEGG